MIINPPVSSLPETNRLSTVAARKVITGKPYFLFSAKNYQKLSTHIILFKSMDTNSIIYARIYINAFVNLPRLIQVK